MSKNRSTYEMQQKIEFEQFVIASFEYAETKSYHVLSTELPDHLLRVWALPLQEGEEAEANSRMVLLDMSNPQLKYVPLAVFSQMLEQRYGKEPLGRDKQEMFEYYDLFQFLILYLYDFRRRGMPVIVFDLFDITQYQTLYKEILTTYGHAGEA